MPNRPGEPRTAHGRYWEPSPLSAKLYGAVVSPRGTTLILPCPPSINDYSRHVGHRVITSKAGRQFQEWVAGHCLVWRVPRIVGEVAVSVEWYRPAKRGDVDNLLKPLLDALKGHAFGDDRHIQSLTIARFDTTPKTPRIVVQISPA